MGEQTASVGRLVGRYVVHDRIAAGGMATVHVGRLLGAAGFSRTVAVKRLHDAYAKDPDFVAMLLDEARLAAVIRHPNVVPTIDIVAEHDELLVVMEYIEGDSIAHLAKLTVTSGERIPVAFAASMVAGALHGLHAAHEARDRNGMPLGIVHRDVSPQNILVGTDGVARVLDFGIAKAASRATATEDGQLKGKTAYMAPEQLQHGAVDRRTDVFAAGVVLWELLTGQRLFFADSPSEIMSRVLTAPIEPPQKHAPHVPPSLSGVCIRALSRDASARFATAEEMALALEDAIAMPRAKDVGSWVATTARAVLESRALLVQEVERSSHTLPLVGQTSDPALARAIEEAERRRQHADMPTDVGGRAPAPVSNPPQAPFSAPPPAPNAYASAPRVLGIDEGTGLASVQSTYHPAAPVRPASRAAWVIALAAAATLVVLVVIGIAVVRARTPPAAAASNAETLGAPTSEPAPPASPAPPSVVSASTSVSTPASTTAIAPSASTTAKTLPPKGTATARKPPKSCDPPFTIDASGKKHFKPECPLE